MTTRHAAYLVVLDDDVREDDAEPILAALRMVRRVAAVEPIEATYEQHVARVRRDAAWRERLLDLVREVPS